MDSKAINEITEAIIGRVIFIHQKLGPGLLESVYQRVLVFELIEMGYRVEFEVSISVRWKNKEIGDAFRADLIVNDVVLVELKSTEIASQVHWKQTKTDAVLAGKPVGLLIKFGKETLIEGVSRIANGIKD
ncbi:MAG: GxxExxY protein [Verrucomicrobiales bacterium]